MCPTLATQVTATIIMVGLLGSILVAFPSARGRRRRLAAEYGATAVLPVTALTCLWSPGTPLTPVVTGWGAKQLFACKQDQSGAANLRTTGRLLIGSILILAIRTWAESAPRSSTWPVPYPLSWCLLWAKTRMLTCLIATTWVASFPLWRRRMSRALTEVPQLSRITPV